MSNRHILVNIAFIYFHRERESELDEERWTVLAAFFRQTFHAYYFAFKCE